MAVGGPRTPATVQGSVDYHHVQAQFVPFSVHINVLRKGILIEGMQEV
jgi:hypothetical protein